MTPVRLEPAAPRSRVKHSTTEPLRPKDKLKVTTKLQHNVLQSYSCVTVLPTKSDSDVIFFFYNYKVKINMYTPLDLKRFDISLVDRINTQVIYRL